jgi:hypothetical protein
MLTNKLVNATHKDVSFPYDKGVILTIPADGQLDLTMDQMDDFRNDKPGSEEVRNQLEYHGLFLLDGDRSYEEQAFTAIRHSISHKKNQYDAFVQRLRDSRIATGSPVTEEAMEEAVDRAGYITIQRDIDKLQKRIKVLEKVLEEKGPKGKVKETLDPRRTCFVTDPPREFPSETALELFLLDQEPDFVERHKTLQTGMLGEGAAHGS